jgi:hypothetical protein
MICLSCAMGVYIRPTTAGGVVTDGGANEPAQRSTTALPRPSTVSRPNTGPSPVGRRVIAEQRYEAAHFRVGPEHGGHSRVAKCSPASTDGRLYMPSR